MAQGFNARKAAQVAAFFALSEGGSVNILKLMKLVYLADREFLARYDIPILFDRFVSMPHGPVNSQTYSYAQGEKESPGEWDKFVSDRENHEISVSNKEIGVDDLDELSEAELEVLSEISVQFKNYTGFALRDYTHKNCPEWENPNGSSYTIPYERLLKFLNKSKAEEITAEISTLLRSNAILASSE